MPLPATDEQLIIDGIAGEGLTTLDDLNDKLDSILFQLIRLRELAEQGQLAPAAMLVNEFMARADLDGGRGLGGSIYGRDFILDDTDPEFPPMLAPIHQHPQFPTGDALPPVMTWQQYLATWT